MALSLKVGVEIYYRNLVLVKYTLKTTFKYYRSTINTIYTSNNNIILSNNNLLIVITITYYTYVLV